MEFGWKYYSVQDILLSSKKVSYIAESEASFGNVRSVREDAHGLPLILQWVLLLGLAQYLDTILVVMEVSEVSH